MLKICRLFPDMYIITAFMGSAFAGAMAISHAFFIFRVSVSCGVDLFEFVTCFRELFKTGYSIVSGKESNGPTFEDEASVE